jgi:cytochrome bd-type quinol oxidase subunit 1
VLTGLATLGVAATPLDRSAAVDTLHGIFATAGYVSLVAVPLLAFVPLRQRHPRLANAGLVAAAVSAVSLALTLSGLPTGLFQRVGLSSTDVWIVIAASMMATGRLSDARLTDGR